MKAVAAHLALGMAANAMGIDRQDFAREVTAGSAQFSQSALQLLGLGNGVGLEQIVNGDIGGQKGQSISHLKSLLSEGTLLTAAASAQSGLMDQLKGQARFYFSGGGAAPSAK